MPRSLQKDPISHPVTSYINSLSAPQSKRAMRSDLKTVLALALGTDPKEIDPIAIFEFPWPTIDVPKLNAIKAALIRKYSRRHAAKCFAAVRGVLGACFDLDLIDANHYMKIQRVKGIPVKSNHKTGRRLTDGEVLALARVCAEDLTPAGARDDAIIGLGYTQGPRISEVVGLQIEDFSQDSGDLLIRDSIGGRSRTIRASNSTKESIAEWLQFRGNEPGPLFCPVTKAGRIKLSSMSAVALGKMLRKRAREASVKPFTMHDLRRTFLTNGWSIGIPGTQLKTIAGHSSIETTASYDRGDLEEALRAAEKLYYPSMRRRVSLPIQN